jgi:hypothetical protein
MCADIVDSTRPTAIDKDAKAICNATHPPLDMSCTLN